MSFLRSLATFFLETLETVVMALLLFALSYIFAFQPHQVKGNSMLPNFFNDEHLLTNKLVFLFRSPQRGDVIIFKAPDNPEYDYIKRIIGLPGDTIEVKESHFLVNNRAINEAAYLPAGTLTKAGYYLHEGQKLVVPSNAYFVSGDNRGNSSDSRDFGPVPKKSIIGQAWLMYWPVNKLGIIKEMTYSFEEGSNSFPTTPL